MQGFSEKNLKNIFSFVKSPKTLKKLFQKPENYGTILVLKDMVNGVIERCELLI